MMELEEFRVDVCVCGYHIYKDIWPAVIGKVLACEGEPSNTQDRYAVAVKMDETIVGHLQGSCREFVPCFFKEEAPFAVLSQEVDDILC